MGRVSISEVGTLLKVGLKGNQSSKAGSCKVVALRRVDTIALETQRFEFKTRLRGSF